MPREQHISEYELIVADNEGLLSVLVNEAIKKGKQPYGSPFSDNREGYRTQLCQAVAKIRHLI